MKLWNYDDSRFGLDHPRRSKETHKARSELWHRDTRHREFPTRANEERAPRVTGQKGKGAAKGSSKLDELIRATNCRLWKLAQDGHQVLLFLPVWKVYKHQLQALPRLRGLRQGQHSHSASLFEPSSKQNHDSS